MNHLTSNRVRKKATGEGRKSGETIDAGRLSLVGIYAIFEYRSCLSALGHPIERALDTDILLLSKRMFESGPLEK